jgi:hypothetical protein
MIARVLVAAVLSYMMRRTTFSLLLEVEAERVITITPTWMRPFHSMGTPLPASLMVVQVVPEVEVVGMGVSELRMAVMEVLELMAMVLEMVVEILMAEITAGMEDRARITLTLVDMVEVVLQDITVGVEVEDTLEEAVADRLVQKALRLLVIILVGEVDPSQVSLLSLRVWPASRAITPSSSSPSLFGLRCVSWLSKFFGEGLGKVV